MKRRNRSQLNLHEPDEQQESQLKWLNLIFKRLWPYFSEQSSPLLKDISFSQIDFGSNPIQIRSATVFNDPMLPRNEIEIELNVEYSSNLHIQAQLFNSTFGICNLYFCGNIYVLIQPLIGKMPLAKGLSICCKTEPKIDLEFTDTAKLAKFPIVRPLILNTLKSYFSAFMVSPKSICIPLDSTFKCQQNVEGEIQPKFMPIGVLRVHLKKAIDLPKKDVSIIHKKNSGIDPYIKLVLGTTTMTSTVKQNITNPKWHEYFDFIILHWRGVQLELRVYDHDVNNDDFVGKVQVSISSFIMKPNTVIENSVRLWETSRGIVTFNGIFFPLILDVPLNLPLGHEKLGRDRRRQFSPDPLLSIVTNDKLPIAVIIVFIQEGRNFYRSNGKRLQEMKDLFIQVSVNEQVEKTDITLYANPDPLFMQTFSFVVRNPATEVVRFSLIQKDDVLAVGLKEIKQLIEERKNTVTDFIPIIDNKMYDAYLKCSFTIKPLDRRRNRKQSASTTTSLPSDY
ncbi:hypothetical protein SNEBB_009518 [Seison nebaliae]|nr:hypothetical protein SNEBB_009518 [Seison nebaliae]